MIPLRLRIFRFRSIRGEQTFLFPEEPGLYFMQGVNALEPRLEANGAGKSTVWDALCWVAFDKTPSGLRAGDVCSWDEDGGTYVELDYVLGDDRARNGDLACVSTVRRSWKPNTWTLSHRAEDGTDEEEIDLTKAEGNAFLADLGLAFAPFLNSVLTAQRQPMFLDLDRNAQAALFSEVMGLDRWLGYSAAAGSRASAQDAVTRGLERELHNLEGRLAEAGRQDFSEGSDKWESGRAARVNEMGREHARLVGVGRALKAALGAAREAETNARAAVHVAQPDPGLVKDINRARGDVNDYGMMIDADTKARTAAVLRDQALAENAACPSCGQALSDDALARERRKCDGDFAKAERQLADHVRSRASALARLKELEDEDDARGAALQKGRRDLDDACGAVAGARRQHEANERELDGLEDKAAAAAAEANPYSRMEAQARDAEERLRMHITDARARLDASNERHALLSFWVRGFKEVRLAQIAEALTELEIEVNNSVEALGLRGWEIGFQVDRETKGGGLQRGFSVTVRSPGVGRAVPWAAWSGGEAQRLRVAGNMGLANLVRSRAGATIPLEVWDEPTAGLSPQGVRDLLGALEERARAERRCVWLVDHRAHDFGGFAGGAVVTKTASGSTIAQC